MALVGFEEVMVGIYDDAGEKIKKLFVWRDEKGGTVNMNITGLEKEISEVWASDKRVWMSKRGTGAVTSSFETFNPPQEQLDEVLGKEKDENGSSWVGSDTNPPYVALMAKSHDADGEPVYLALPKGMFGQNEVNLESSTNESTTPGNTTLTGSWQNKDINGKSRVFGKHIGSEKFEDFKDLVFPDAPEPEAV